MDTVRTLGRAAHDFGRAVVEWRSPVSGLYLMAINSAFWALAVYGDADVQCRCLMSIAAGIVGWDVLLSPSRDRSTLMHLVRWPVASFWRTAGVCLSLYGMQRIKAEELELAWKAAYTSLGCLLVNPVWQHHHINAKICYVCDAAYQKTARGVNYAIVQPLLKVYRAVKYVVLLEFVPPLISYVKRKLVAGRESVYARCRAVRDWWRGWVMLPIKEKVYTMARFCRYWLCAEWWPTLKASIRRKYEAVKERCKRLFNSVCFWTTYVVCGHWIKPCARYLRDQLLTLGAYLHRVVWTPLKSWLLWQLSVAADLLTRAAKAAALAIRDSVLWPIGILLLDVLYHLCKMLYTAAVHPLLLLLYDKYKILEDYALIYVLGPACEKLVNNIPEKNPLCDESDVELEGLLPDEISEEAERESDQEQLNETYDEFSLEEPLDFEEAEFASSLAFPAVDASESSDEEFDLHKHAGEARRRRQPRRERSERRGSEAGPEKEGEFDIDEYLPSYPPPAAKQRTHPDDSYELLE